MGTLYVNDEFRTNELSFKPGGYTVKVLYKDGSIRVYDKVKYPGKYIDKARSNPAVKDAFVIQ